MRGHAHRHLRSPRHGGPTIRGFLEPCILLLLRSGPSHGYDLARNLETLGMEGTDPSLVYRMLRAMERRGLVVSEWQSSDSGPARRIYALCSKGDLQLGWWAKELVQVGTLLQEFLEAYHSGETNTDDISC